MANKMLARRSRLGVLAIGMDDVQGYTVPGQGVLPELAETLGYEAIVLKPACERFCWEYVLRGDSPAAAYEVAFPDPKRSREQARKNAHKMLQKEDVRSRIAQIRAELKQRYACTADDLLRYHGMALKMDRREFLDEKGALKPLDLLDSEQAAIIDIKAVPVNGGGRVMVYEIPDRYKSAQELAKILGLSKDKVELTGKDGGPVETSSSVTIYIPDNGRN